MPLSLRGRYLVVAWTAVFLAVAGVITLRDRAGFRALERYEVLQESVDVVTRQRAELGAEIHTRLSAGELTPLGERLGLRIPTDAEIARVSVAVP